MIYFTEEAKERIYQADFRIPYANRECLFVGSTEQIIGAKNYDFQGTFQSFFYEKHVMDARSHLRVVFRMAFFSFSQYIYNV